MIATMPKHVVAIQQKEYIDCRTVRAFVAGTIALLQPAYVDTAVRPGTSVSKFC